MDKTETLIESSSQENKFLDNINMKAVRKAHQIIVLSIIHLFYVLIEIINEFKFQWISSIIYVFIAIGTIVFLWLQKENYNYLLPIPFISLIIVGAILEETITITVIFSFYCLCFFLYQFIRKSESETIVTVISSGITMIVLFCYALFDQGFVIINNNFNVTVFIWLIWNVSVLGLAFIHRTNATLSYSFIVIVLLLASIGPFLGFILIYDNVFAIVNGVVIFCAIVFSLLIVFLEEIFNMRKFLTLISTNLISVVIFNFSFRFSFEWLNSANKSLVVDYALFIPLVLITSVVLTVKFYPEVRTMFAPNEYYYVKNERLQSIDITILATYFIFLIASIFSLIGNIENYEFLLLKLLIISIIVSAASVPLNVKISTITSLLFTLAFLIPVLLFLGNVSSNATFISLLVIVVLVYIFMVINEIFLIGEPLTTNLSIVATLTGMVTSMVYFYIENMNFKEMLTSITWSLIGIFLFAFGIIFYHLYIRRSGFIIVIVDIIYSLISMSVRYKILSLQVGITFTIQAIVLLTCVFLLRWSEKREERATSEEAITES